MLDSHVIVLMILLCSKHSAFASLVTSSHQYVYRCTCSLEAKGQSQVKHHTLSAAVSVEQQANGLCNPHAIVKNQLMLLHKHYAVPQQSVEAANREA